MRAPQQLRALLKQMKSEPESDEDSSAVTLERDETSKLLQALEPVSHFSSVFSQPSRPSVPRAASPAAWAQGEGGILPLCPALLRPLRESCV